VDRDTITLPVYTANSQPTFFKLDEPCLKYLVQLLRRVISPSPVYAGQHTHKQARDTYMHEGFKPATPVFEGKKTVHVKWPGDIWHWSAVF